MQNDVRGPEIPDNHRDSKEILKELDLLDMEISKASPLKKIGLNIKRLDLLNELSKNFKTY